jgi:hypothetical protein
VGPGGGSDGAQAAALERSVANHPAGNFGQVGDRGPADVATLRAFAGIEVPSVAGHVTPGSAGKTLDPDLLHWVEVGNNSHMPDPQPRDSTPKNATD